MAPRVTGPRGRGREPRDRCCRNYPALHRGGPLARRAHRHRSARSAPVQCSPGCAVRAVLDARADRVHHRGDVRCGFECRQHRQR
ncbi:hypothetical protein ACFPRL_35910 [Pseudoclavibacter helvolus]